MFIGNVVQLLIRLFSQVSAGAQFRFAHLFVVFLSNFLAIFLQSLCVKVGSVTGVDLATNCREHLPKWVNISLYVLAECAIIATDLAEVRHADLFQL